MSCVFEATLQLIVRLQFLIVAVQLRHTPLVSDFAVGAPRGEHTINAFQLVREIQRVENVSFLIGLIHKTLRLLCQRRQLDRISLIDVRVH